MRTARILSLFLSIQFFLYNMGLLGRRLSLLASALSLLIFISLSLPEQRLLARGAHVVPAFGLFLALAVIVRGSHEEVFAFPALLASMLLLPAREDHAEGERRSLLLAVFLFSTIIFSQLHVPVIWYFLHAWGLMFSQFAGRLIAQEYLLGQTAAGVPVFLGFFSYHTVVAIFSRSGGLRYFIKTTFILLILQVAVLVLLTPIAIIIQLKEPGWDLLFLHPECFIFGGLLFSLLVKPPAPAPVSGRSGLRTSLVAGLIAFICSGFLALRPDPGAGGGTILIYDKGYLNWKTPEYGYYGHKSGGMFGYLPQFVEAAGYEVKKSRELTRDELSGADAVILINVLDYFSDGEKEAVREFVRGGGGLLALGDHTGVQGIRGPFNDLLSPFGIEFLFDSSTFLTKGWGEEAVLLPHPVTHGLSSPAEMDIWVGATLDLRLPARPVVVAKYGFSDIGDITAVDHAYLGNRIYDPGEQLGDLLLVAETEYGRGRVLVFGDTSPFQNSALVFSHRFVSRVLSWLVSGGSPGPLRRVILPILLALIAAAVVVRRNALMAGVVSAAVLVGVFSGSAPRRIPRSTVLDIPTAIVDHSHFERFDQLTWFDDCTGGLLYNLMRAGYFPINVHIFSAEQISSSKVVVIIAPVEPFNETESVVLDRFMAKGGWVLYACGNEERDGSWRFLERHGLRLLDVPLTTFTDDIWGSLVNVQEGWGVEVMNPRAEVLAEKYGYPYIVKVNRGAGGMIFIADSYFLLNRNIEGMEEYYEGNIEFLKNIFEGFSDGFPSDSTGSSEDGTGVGI